MSARMPQPPRSSFEGDDLAAYDQVIARLGRMTDGESEYLDAGAYWGALLNSPDMAATIASLGALMRTRADREATFSHADREFVDMVLSFDWDYRGVLGIHIPDALAVGVRLEAIEALRAGREEELTDDERLLAAYIRAVVSGRVTDEALAAMEARLGRRGALEYTIFITFLQLTIRLWMALGVPDIPDAQVEAMLQEFRDGTRPLPDYRLRIG